MGKREIFMGGERMFFVCAFVGLRVCGFVREQIVSREKGTKTTRVGVHLY